VRAWRAITRELRHYDSAVIAARDRDGYPVSVRCVPIPDERTATFAVALPEGLGVESGPAWLLCHFHDERFWSLRSFGARGSLERTGGSWRFRPARFVPGMGGRTPPRARLSRNAGPRAAGDPVGSDHRDQA